VKSKEVSFLGVLVFAAAFLYAMPLWSQTYSVIYSFNSPTTGINPVGTMAVDSSGNLYGTTENGGTGNCSVNNPCGVLFELTRGSDGTWQETVLHDFQGLGGDGGYPTAPVVLDSHGNLYTASNCVQDCFEGFAGDIVKFTPNPNGPWPETVIFTSIGNNCSPTEYGTGGEVVCSAALDHAGKLYGVTVGGGTYGIDCTHSCGTVLSFGQVSIDSYYQITVHNFLDGPSDGRLPQGSLAFDADNNIYGTTGSGGTDSMGTVYMLTPNRNSFGWREVLLHAFQGGPSDGANPISGVVLDSAGNVYGTTLEGGTAGFGTVFMLTPQMDGTWTETVLYSFRGGIDAASPNSSLTFDSAGNLWGTALGGASDKGTLFELTYNGNSWTERVVHTFVGGEDGSLPYGGVVLDTAGNLYGTAVDGGTGGGGVAYEITRE